MNLISILPQLPEDIRSQIANIDSTKWIEALNSDGGKDLATLFRCALEHNVLPAEIEDLAKLLRKRVKSGEIDHDALITYHRTIHDVPAFIRQANKNKVETALSS